MNTVQRTHVLIQLSAQASQTRLTKQGMLPTTYQECSPVQPTTDPYTLIPGSPNLIHSGIHFHSMPRWIRSRIQCIATHYGSKSTDSRFWANLILSSGLLALKRRSRTQLSASSSRGRRHQVKMINWLRFRGKIATK